MYDTVTQIKLSATQQLPFGVFEYPPVGKWCNHKCPACLTWFKPHKEYKTIYSIGVEPIEYKTTHLICLGCGYKWTTKGFC